MAGRNNSFPNIVILLLDTAGAKHFSLYDHYRPTTPNIEKISRSAVVYTRCFSPAPWTLPAHASLFTGLYPSQHMIDGTRLKISKSFYTLPEILSKNGYQTYGISANPLISRQFCHGFDIFHETFHLFEESELMKKIKRDYFLKTDRFMILPYIKTHLDVVENIIYEPVRRLTAIEKINLVCKAALKNFGSPERFTAFTKVLLNLANRKRNNVHSNATPSTLKIFKMLTRQLRKFAQDQRPFFLFVNFMQLHDHYNPPSQTKNSFVQENKEHESIIYDLLDHYAIKPFSKEFLRYLEAKYDEELLFMDRIVIAIDTILHELDLVDDTVFIITSDHGEAFGEHGHVQHWFSTYNELIHIPLIIRYPRGIKAAGVNDSLVQLHDLYATINEIAGTPFPSPESSISLLASEKRQVGVSQVLDVQYKLIACKIRNKEFDAEHFDFTSPEISVITNNMYKLIQRGSNYECYDLNKGFYETENIESETDDKVPRNLKSILEKMKDNLGYDEVDSSERVIS